MLHRGDDTNAFGAKFLEIYLENATGLKISKAEFRCGEVLKTIKDPKFPLLIDLTTDESIKLRDINNAYLAIYDKDGLKRTCEGSITFETVKKVV